MYVLYIAHVIPLLPLPPSFLPPLLPSPSLLFLPHSPLPPPLSGLEEALEYCQLEEQFSTVPSKAIDATGTISRYNDVICYK